MTDILNFDYSKIAFADIKASIDHKDLYSLIDFYKKPAQFGDFKQVREKSPIENWIYTVKEEWTGISVYNNPFKTHFTLDGKVPEQNQNLDCHLVEKYFDQIEQITIMKLSAGGTIDWHSHNNLEVNGVKTTIPLQGYVVHIPIITHHNVYYDCRKSLDKDFKKIRKTFELGSVWYFNSFYWHRVKNNSPYDRISLNIYVNKYSQFLNKAIIKSKNQNKCYYFEDNNDVKEEVNVEK